MYKPEMKRKFLDQAEQYGSKRLVDKVKRARGDAAKVPSPEDGMVHEMGEMPEDPEMHAAEGEAGEMAEELGATHEQMGRLTPDEIATLKALVKKLG